MINILIVDDHQVLIDGLKALLENAEHIHIVEQALNGQAAIDALSQHTEINMVLLDINLPDINGYTVCRKMKAKYPEIKVLALTMHDEAGFITQMVKAGADGYMLKNTGQDELIHAIETIAGGGKHFGQEVTDALLSGMQSNKKVRSSSIIQKLTRREKEILQLIVDEHTTEEIAKKLFISNTTVITHRKSLLRKLDAKNTAGLVRKALEFKLLD